MAGDSNGNRSLISATNVPVLGRQYEILAAEPVVMLRCRCAPGMKPLTLMGVNAVSQCPSCARIYVVNEFVYERAKQSASIAIGIDASKVSRVGGV